MNGDLWGVSPCLQSRYDPEKKAYLVEPEEPLQLGQGHVDIVHLCDEPLIVSGLERLSELGLELWAVPSDMVGVFYKALFGGVVDV